eukprot:CAMPEP_0116062600 /NCGR_PEP_ID=MMETSP0322-20121206/7875_1 /TAXON_ID=163516 /ORGANISM="Leptocylindrus danicus var. apora, Strain B651" /LENGTH=274 /DNA_ID=CAMNT_0003547977 /DNA_START=211 /DNA_END=1035 /DNA_ORIENTATION=-
MTTNRRAVAMRRKRHEAEQGTLNQNQNDEDDDSEMEPDVSEEAEKTDGVNPSDTGSGDVTSSTVNGVLDLSVSANGSEERGQLDTPAKGRSRRNQVANVVAAGNRRSSNARAKAQARVEQDTAPGYVPTRNSTSDGDDGVAASAPAVAPPRVRSGEGVGLGSKVNVGAVTVRGRAFGLRRDWGSQEGEEDEGEGASSPTEIVETDVEPVVEAEQPVDIEENIVTQVTEDPQSSYEPNTYETELLKLKRRLWTIFAVGWLGGVGVIVSAFSVIEE